MNDNVGLWIDRRKAVVVTLDEEEVTVRTVESGVPRQVRLSGGARSRTPCGPQDVVSDSRRHGKHQKFLTEFYRSLIESFRGASALYLLEPGEAKHELRREIEKVKALRGRIMAVGTRDKMSDSEISTAVKYFFRNR